MSARRKPIENWVSMTSAAVEGRSRRKVDHSGGGAAATQRMSIAIDASEVVPPWMLRGRGSRGSSVSAAQGRHGMQGAAGAVPVSAWSCCAPCHAAGGAVRGLLLRKSRAERKRREGEDLDEEHDEDGRQGPAVAQPGVQRRGDWVQRRRHVHYAGLSKVADRQEGGGGGVIGPHSEIAPNQVL